MWTTTKVVTAMRKIMSSPFVPHLHGTLSFSSQCLLNPPLPSERDHINFRVSGRHSSAHSRGSKPFRQYCGHSRFYHILTQKLKWTFKRRWTKRNRKEAIAPECRARALHRAAIFREAVELTGFSLYIFRIAVTTWSLST